MIGPDDRRLFLALPLVALLVWAPGLGGRFLDWDDSWLVERSGTIRALSGPSLARMFDPTIDRTWYGAEYLPLRDLSYALDFAVWGTNPVGYHITNTILHALTALVLALWLAELGYSNRVALLSGLLFAIHPIHAESVVWISGRKDVLCGLLFFAGLLLHRRADRATPARAALLEAGAVLAGTAAIAAKAMAVVFPAALLLADLLHPSASGRRRRLAVFAAASAAALALAAIDVHVGRQFLIRDYPAGRSTVLFTMAVVFLSYVRRLALPIGLSPVADFPFFAPGHPVSIAGLAALTASVVALSLGFLRRRTLSPAGRVLVFAGAWFFVTMAPFSNLIPFRHLLADRYLYLASAGASLALAWAVTRLRPGRSWAVALAVVLAFAGLSVRQARLFSDPLLLYEEALARDPENHFLHLFRGEALAAIDHPGAEPELLLALSNPPRSTPFDLSQAWLALANFRFGRGNLSRAEEAYREAVRIDPTRAAAWAGLGNSRKAAGDPEGALSPFERASLLAPEDPSYPHALGACCFALGRFEDAGRWFERALDRDPEWYVAREGLAEIARSRGDLASAANHLDAAIATAEGVARLHLSRAEVALEAGDAALARRHLDRAAAAADPREARRLEDLARRLGSR